MSRTTTPSDTLPPRLSEQLQEERICFSMNCNALVIRSAQPDKVVQLVDGTYGKVPVPAIRLRRGNDHDLSGRTRFYDLTDPVPHPEGEGLTDREIVDAVFEWMKLHPGAIDDVRLQLRVHGETEPVQPFPGYDTTPVEGIRVVLENTDYDLKGLLKYELTVRPTQVDADGNPYEPRDEVVEVLNELQADRDLARIVENEDGVDL